MDKTIKVRVDRKIKHPIGKYIIRSSHYLAHDEDNACSIGDTVDIAQCAKISKNKSWRLVKRNSKNRGIVMIQEESMLHVADNSGARVKCIRV